MLFAKLLVSVPSRCDMEISLDFISIQTAKDPTRIRRPSDPRGLAELPLLRLAQLLMHIPQLFPARIHAVVLAQLVHALLHLPARPLRPVGRIVAKQVTGECAVAGRVLHVDAQVVAVHGDYYVEVYLHVVGYALLDGEGLCGRTGVPSRYLGPGEVYACEDECYGPRGRIAPLDEICLFGLGCALLVSQDSKTVYGRLGRTRLIVAMKLDTPQHRNRIPYNPHAKTLYLRKASKLDTMPPFEAPNASSSRP